MRRARPLFLSASCENVGEASSAARLLEVVERRFARWSFFFFLITAAWGQKLLWDADTLLSCLCLCLVATLISQPTGQAGGFVNVI